MYESTDWLFKVSESADWSLHLPPNWKEVCYVAVYLFIETFVKAPRNKM